PAWEQVGVDQEIGFGLEVIDEESDEIIVELIEKPESASYDPVTLTVVWKPSRDDMPRGRFRVRVTEKRGEDRPTRVYTHEFSIAVDAEPQPPPVARELGPVVETLLTIRDPARLAAVNEQWPIDAMLERAARSAHAALPEGEQAGVSVASRKELYRAFLAELARVNQNPSV